MPRILFVHNYPSRFIRLDLESLREQYRVTECYLRSPLVNPRVLWRQVATHDLVFGWFASWHTFLPVLFARFLKKPSLLIVGGYDLAKVPEIGYGHQRGGVRRLVSTWTMRLASCLVTNSYHSQDEAMCNVGIGKERVHVIYHGLPDPFESLPKSPRARMALSVGVVSRHNLWRKGHELFVRTAALIPDMQFVLVGAWADRTVEHLRSIASPNVVFPGPVDDETLLDYYRRAAVYVQVSLHEGFGVTVAEAMLAGCLPVVTRAGALSEVVGECGVYVETARPLSIVNAIEKALKQPERMRDQARQRVLSRFPLKKRQQHFTRLIASLLDS